MATPTMHTVRVALVKPSVKTSNRRTRGTRQFMGISWGIIDPNRPIAGVRTAYTFIGLPSAGHLVGGDIILRVSDEPTSTNQDVVFHWERAAAGDTVIFHVHREETHKLVLSHDARDAVLAMGWSTQAGKTPAPFLGAGTASADADAPALQVPAAGQSPQPSSAQAGDLVLAVNGTPVSTADEAAALLQRADGFVEVAVRRGAPDALEGVEGVDCCLPCFRSVTVVPKPKRQPKKKAGSSTMGDTLLDDDTAFELRESPNDVEMDS